MEQRINKPRVFLSHSKKDVEFIKQMESDLKKCQIDSWLDENEIRHGKSWQDAIFEYGLPTCDAILVYLTENSISSPVVKKEMDAGLLQTFKDSNVAFLPYVKDAQLREQLRSDIQALQIPEWNEGNYSVILPRVVAEIWRGFLERTVASATKDERLKRIQLELELEKNKGKGGGIFTEAENVEFEFILNSFDRIIPLTIKHIKKDKESPPTQEVIGAYEVNLYLSTLLPNFINFDKNEFNINQIYFDIQDEGLRLSNVLISNKDADTFFQMDKLPEFTDELLMYGLVESSPYSSDGPFGRSSIRYKYIFSEKYFRFRYWLTYHKRLPENVHIEKA